MKLIYSFLILILSLVFVETVCSQSINRYYTGHNIGTDLVNGTTSFDYETQTYILTGAGENMWFDRDECWFEHLEISGDFIMSANVKFMGKGKNAHRKAGLMVRSGLKSNEVYLSCAVHGDGLTATQFRTQKGNNTREIQSEISAPEFIQIERKGNNYIVRVSKKKKPLQVIAEKTMELGDKVNLGMFVCSHEPGILESAKFWNVRIEVPAKEGLNGYENPSPSRLEVLDIKSGVRTVLYETQEHIEAPNWSRDGKFLIYNSSGKLYRFGLVNRKVSEINTGFATANNNDHGISFDGKTLAISHHTKENEANNSIIYTLPVEGGTPNRITNNGPSYWHGWSPDGKWLTYCAERNGNYDVYKIPANGGDEIRLTNSEGLDDGPEYSHDGEYIYFNSVRSGSMEIWRMKPDGSEQKQVTNDKFQNWFAHPSPDGKWLIMISYLPEVPAGSHPHNQRVMLRLMPVEGGEIKTLAFLYGGQGTLNVPSWSPDSKKVAFVSYTY